MTTAVGSPARPEQPRPRRWTKEEYYKMGELGWFQDEYVELLDGEIVEMPIPGSPHCVSTDNVAEALGGIFPRDRYWVRTQMPLSLGLDTEPLPDVGVVEGPKSSYKAHPTTALLVVEVSDSTLQSDRERKGSLYARAGLADYWIVNLVDRQVEVLRRPVVDPTALYGYRYAEATIRKETETVTPLAAPQVEIAVASLLP